MGAWLSFISERDGDREVYLIHPSGAPERRLTARRGGDYNGPASPDGSELIVTAVTETQAGQQQRLQLMALPEGLFGDGAAATAAGRPLGPARAVVRHPAWSADGAFVIFEGDAPPGYRDLFRIRRDGSGLRRLTANPEGNFEPALSPRGDELVFVSSRDRVAELYRARLDGSAPQRLTRTRRDEWSPRWSSDGALLAFASDRDGADRLYLMRTASGETARVTGAPLATEVVEESPSFSPRAQLLAYVVRRGERAELFVHDIAAGTRRQVAAELGAALGEPAWSPDGRYLAFTAQRGEDAQIYVARRDGSGAVRVTAAAGPNWNPRWLGRAAPR